jgi:mono/diheme cytochrome c family protein
VKNQLLLCLCLVSAVGSVLAAAANEPAKSRGQLLYENHCIRCHANSVHSRNPRRVHNLPDLYQWVDKWAKLQKLEWSQDEIRDVVDYLNHKYYKLKK